MGLPKLRTIVCSAIVLAFGVATLVIFGSAKPIREEYKAAKLEYSPTETAVNTFKNNHVNDPDAYLTWDATEQKGTGFLEPGVAIYDQYLPLLTAMNEKKAVMDGINARYTGFAVTGYVLSLATLTSFGLALHYLDKAKEKDDAAVEAESIRLEKKAKEEEEAARLAAKKEAAK